jgi:hypothetical protein
MAGVGYIYDKCAKYKIYIYIYIYINIYRYTTYRILEQWPGENADPLPQLTTRGVGFSFHNKIERIRCLFMFEVCLVKLLTTVSTPRVTHLNPHYNRIKVAQELLKMFFFSPPMTVR